MAVAREDLEPPVAGVGCHAVEDRFEKFCDLAEEHLLHGPKANNKHGLQKTPTRVLTIDSVSMPFLVIWDADAAGELSTMTSKEEKKALLVVVDKLRHLGERLVPPHMKPLKGGGALRELRPRQGKTYVRAIYRRSGDDYVILSLCLKPDKADWHTTVAAAEKRSTLYG